METIDRLKETRKDRDHQGSCFIRDVKTIKAAAMPMKMITTTVHIWCQEQTDAQFQEWIVKTVRNKERFISITTNQIVGGTEM